MMEQLKHQGVTLLEMMVVVALIAVIASIATPEYIKMLERNRVKEAAEALKSDIQLARTQAIKNSQNVIVTKNTGNGGAWCYGFDSNATACDCTETDTSAADYCDVLRTSGANFRKTSLISSSGNTTFDFRRGTANSSSVCVSTSNFKLKIVINNVGKVEVCSDTTAPVAGYESCSSNC